MGRCCIIYKQLIIIIVYLLSQIQATMEQQPHTPLPETSLTIPHIPLPKVSPTVPVIPHIPLPKVSSTVPVMPHVPLPKVSPTVPVMPQIPIPKVSPTARVMPHIPLPKVSTIVPVMPQIPIPKGSPKTPGPLSNSVGDITPMLRNLTLNVAPRVSVPLALNIVTPRKTLIEMGMGTITEYQNEILQECIQKGSGGLLLPMGTGKTLLSVLISLIQSSNYTDNKILVVVSKSLITTWKEEIAKFFGNALRYEIFHKESIKAMANWIPTGDIIITTPEVISKIYTKYNVASGFTYTERENRFGPETRYYRAPETPCLNYPCGEGRLYSIKWGAIIVDEAHNYFNPTSARCLALSSLCAHHRWLLSGTLLAEPKPDKLFGYHLMLNHPDAPRNLPGFKEYIDSENYMGIAHTLIKREGNRDFVPPIINKVVISHPLSETEASIYTNLKSLLGILKARLTQYKRAGDKVNTKKFSSYIMGMISHMRQCLVCPLIPITTVAIDVADFEQRSELSEMFMDHINGMGIDEWLNDINSINSSRIRAVTETVNRHQNERIIIFSCYRTVIDVISLYLPQNRPLFTISGDDKIETRSRTIESYRNSPDGILLLTYDIGANGLNLQCSSTALLVDFWWNAGKSEQAVARLLRPGQLANTVNLYYFTANSGIENALFKLQTAKLAMGEEILTGRMNTTTKKIKVDEIIRLIDLEDNITILNELIS